LIQCPWCDEHVVISNDICPNCLHEVIFDYEGEAEYDDEPLTYDELRDKIYNAFHCKTCNCNSCKIDEVAMTGTTLSKILEIQHKHYLFVSCTNCGIVNIINPNIILKSKRGLLGTMLDIIF